MTNYFFIENYTIKHLKMNDKLKSFIRGVIIVCESKLFKPKALPRRARGKNRTSPVPSCLIQRKKIMTAGGIVLAECGAFYKAVE